MKTIIPNNSVIAFALQRAKKMKMKKMKKMKKKMKMGDFKVRSFPTIHGRLLSRPIYNMAVLYLTLQSLVSAMFSLIRKFAPIPMYGENETTRTIPT